MPGFNGVGVKETISYNMPGFNGVGVKETIMVACLYLWWMRRKRTRGEPIPPIHKCKMLILGITANAFKSLSSKWQSLYSMV
jgi:hypothetical protein